MKKKTLLLVFIGMTSQFVVEICQGHKTQGQQSVVRIAKSTVEVHSVWLKVCVVPETERQMRDIMYYAVHLRKSEGTTPRYTNITKIIFR